MLVTTPEPTSITDAYALMKSLNTRIGYVKEETAIKVVVNRVANYEEGRNLYNKLNIVVSKYLNINLEFLGIIPVDSNMSRAVIQQKPITMLYPDSDGSKAFSELADALVENREGREVKRKGLASAIVSMFKKKNEEN